MKAVGATAGWENPFLGQQPAVNLTGMHAGVQGHPAPNEFLEFVVCFRGNELIREALTTESAEALVAGTLFRAARILELLGVQVMPR
jgi:hypothetical protein